MTQIPETKTSTASRRGVIAGSAGVLRELLATTRVRRSIEVILRDLDEENAPLIVDALFDDPALLLELLSAAPALVNGVTSAQQALLLRLAAIPPTLLQRFARRLLDQLDAEALGRLVATALLLAQRLGPALEAERLESAFCRGFDEILAARGGAEGPLLETLIDELSENATRLAGRLGEASQRDDSTVARGVAALSRGVERVVGQNPALVTGVIRPLTTAWQRAVDDAEEEASHARSA